MEKNFEKEFIVLYSNIFPLFIEWPSYHANDETLLFDECQWDKA